MDKFDATTTTAKRRRGPWILGALAIVLVGGVATTVATAPRDGHQVSPRSGGQSSGDVQPTVNRPAISPEPGVSPPPGVPAAGATIPGTSTAEVTSKLASVFGVSFTDDGTVSYYVKFVKPGTDREISMVTSHPRGDTTGPLSGLACRILRPAMVVDRAVLTDIETCLAPALNGTEQTDVPAWLDKNASGVQENKPQTVAFARFNLFVSRNGADILDVRLLAR
ncbi:hypothetical protein Lfu02_29660 [Longispora fulva]|uniref:Uncharacterized protein n=1 Tax=Longispora fulva TaxID=619741 RepID=A0A8J7KMF8_9ACTN|nr:hypothetical protein [Longispora fulva]MBG6139101.1 hypothetical protein [Longispora fulva]GIG58594.1 hypothetical protein Lfu02_29660 [Longispora fulva]